MHILAAVAVQSPAEELHAHDGEGIVEGEQCEAKAGEAEGQGRQGGWVRGAVAAACPGPPALTAGGMPLALASDHRKVSAGEGPRGSWWGTLGTDAP